MILHKCVNWTELAQDRVHWGIFCENGNEHSSFIEAEDFVTGWLTAECAMELVNLTMAQLL
jgi:hypothetical protein